MSIAKSMMVVTGGILLSSAWLSCVPPADLPPELPSSTPTRTPTLTMRNIGPFGGHIKSVAFHPTNPAEAWASGGGASGVYRSTDGGQTWVLFENTPPNRSSCRLTFDPFEPERVYAPDSAGGGMLLTADGGGSWSFSWKGLPNTADNGMVHDMAADPKHPGVVYLGTSGGLYLSSDYGASFSRVDSLVFGYEVDFRATRFDSDGRLFLGTAGGGVFYFDIKRQLWDAIISPESGIPVTDLAPTLNGLYIAYGTGHICRTEALSAADLQWLGYNTFTSGGNTCVAVVSGLSARKDVIYVGTSAAEADPNWGLFRSTDGGATFHRSDNGLEGWSISCLAVSPHDPQRMLAGTGGGGLFKSLDAGESWSRSDHGIFAGRSKGMAENARNAAHLLIASGGEANGVPDLAETFDGGATWGTVSSLKSCACCIDMDPRDANVILVGGSGGSPTPRAGIYRTVDGSSGPWQPVLPQSIHIARISRHLRQPDILYANAVGFVWPATAADQQLYSSQDNGTSWQKLGITASGFAIHPEQPQELIVVSEDAYATTDRFEDVTVSLGLAEFAPGESFTAVSFHPARPTTVLVAGSSGDLFVTDSYAPQPSRTTWRRLTTNVRGLRISRTVIVPRPEAAAHFYFIACPDDEVRATGSGVYRSTDEGASWENVTGSARPCTIAMDIVPSTAVAGRLYLPLQGGGLLELNQEAAP